MMKKYERATITRAAAAKTKYSEHVKHAEIELKKG